MTTKDLDHIAHATREEAFAVLCIVARLRRLGINPADVLRTLANKCEGECSPR